MNQFYCVDWGSTHLRVRLVERSPFRVLAETTSGAGVAPLHAELRAQGGGRDPLAFFAEKLAAASLAIGLSKADHDKTPVVVSGMAAASIGMRELPYAKAPLADHGEDLVVSQLDSLEAFPAGVLLVSGVATSADMIRGEEVEWLGLVAQGFSADLYLLPGTHSKHLTIVDGRLVGIQTFLTGELFQLLSRHSILADNVDPSEPARPTPTFLDGVRESQQENTAGLLGELFSVRSRALLAGATAQAGSDRLSGLLIGAELRTLTRTADSEPLILAASESLQPLYVAALDEVGVPFVAVSPSQRGEAVPRAHALLLDRFALC